MPVYKVSTKSPIGVFLLVLYKSTKQKDFMRKIERKMNTALLSKKNWAGSNTTVTYNEFTNCSSVLLHGHNIATLDHNTKALKLSSCGYETVTTKSRLNAILEETFYGCKVFQKNWNWFVSKYNKTVDFVDGMIILNTSDLEVA